jgi:type IV pilus assembly protein PilF
MLFQVGRNADAADAFRRALELDPYLTDAHNFLGVVYTEMGRPEEAEEQFRVALDDPAYPTPENIYLNLALAYAAQGRDDEAIGQLRTAVEINPRFYKAHFELASLLDRVGKIDEAAREYEVARPDYRNVGEFYYRLGFVYFRLGDQSKARENLERAMEVAPGSNSAAQANDLLEMMN